MFLRDYLKHLLDGDSDKPFLSPFLITVNKDLLPFAFGLLDMKLTAKSSNSNHKFEATEGRGMKITAGLNSFVVKKDLSVSTEFEQSDIVIKHRYFE